MWGSNNTNSPLNCSCVFPSPPDFCSPLLLPVCRLEATSSSSSFSRTNLSGHNRLPLQLCCFWNGNPFSPACSPSWLTEISQKDTLLWRIYSISALSTDSRFFFFFSSLRVFVCFYSSMWKLCDHGHPAGDLFKMWSHSALLSPSILPIGSAWQHFTTQFGNNTVIMGY